MPLVLLVRTPQFRAFVLSPSSSFFEHAYASLLAIIATVDSILLTFVVVRPSTSTTPLDEDWEKVVIPSCFLEEESLSAEPKSKEENA